jgi:sugar lactone lactonase YvrE
VTTLAGDGTASFADNTDGTLAEFNQPIGITTDGTNLYVADLQNNRIRKVVIATGAVTTVAGDGTPAFADNADGTMAEFNFPEGITTDGTNLYVADTGNHRIRKIQ